MTMREYIFYAFLNGAMGALFGFGLAHLLHVNDIWRCLP